MNESQFPNLTYLITKSYEGINRQEFAELAALYVSQIREQLQNYSPSISKPIDKSGYEATLQSVMQLLDELETYFRNFHHNQRRVSKTVAQQAHASLLKQVALLEKLSQR